MIMDYKNLLDRLEQEKKFKEEMDLAIQQDELKFLWTAVKPLLDFLCFINFDRKYKIRSYGEYYSFILGNETEEQYRKHIELDVFSLGQFKETFMGRNPHTIDITVRANPDTKVFNLEIFGIDTVLTNDGNKEVKKKYNSIDELVLDISNYLVNNAVIID
jgi:hypothetical protein